MPSEVISAQAGIQRSVCSTDRRDGPSPWRSVAQLGACNGFEQAGGRAPAGSCKKHTGTTNGFWVTWLCGTVL